MLWTICSYFSRNLHILCIIQSSAHFTKNHVLLSSLLMSIKILLFHHPKDERQHIIDKSIGLTAFFHYNMVQIVWISHDAIRVLLSNNIGRIIEMWFMEIPRKGILDSSLNMQGSLLFLHYCLFIWRLR